MVHVRQPREVAVYLTAMHLCTAIRGVRESNSRTWTTNWRGNYEQDQQLRSEFLETARSRFEH